ncbi:MAG: hypothetical protein ACKVOP_09050 [Sphingomonadaceae bacterium]
MDRHEFELAMAALQDGPQNDLAAPMFIMGMILGVVATLLIQAYGRRKARLAAVREPQTDRAIELLSTENEQQQGLILRLEDRIAVLERIATDKPLRLAAEIETLR